MRLLPLSFIFILLTLGCIHDVEQPQIVSNQTQNFENKEDLSQKYQIHAEIWSQHSPSVQSYEFKVNCFGDYSKLEECFLWDVDSVRVIDPQNRTFQLQKDFNVNNYSGETTRRWVLYGPPEGGLPESGTYTFEYVKNGSAIVSQNVEYVQSKISYPTNVKWEKRGSDMFVSWTPPAGITSEIWYKIIVWNEFGTPTTFVSLQFPWNSSEGTLTNVPFVKGGNYSLNVAIFYKDGYAYSEYVKFTW